MVNKISVKNRKLLRNLIVFLSIVCIFTVSILFSSRPYDTSDYDLLIKESIKEQEVATEFKSLGKSKKTSYDIIGNSEFLELSINKENCDIAIFDKRTNDVYYTYPTDLEKDEKANAYQKDYMRSTFLLNYYDTSRIEQSMLSSEMSVDKGQFKIESIKDGARITFTLADLSLGYDFLPQNISEKRLEEKILNNLSKDDAKYVKKRYVKDGKGGLVIIKTVKTSTMVSDKLVRLFIEAGYTEEDLAEDNGEVVSTSAKKPEFTIPVEFRLIDDALKVNINTSEIEENEAGKVSSIELLSYFLGGSTKDNGYLFVPNGSGSIINFNNGKVKEKSFSLPMYGYDTQDKYNTDPMIYEKARMPVFGVSKEKSGVLGYIENGASISQIQADISGKTSSQNNVYPKFKLRRDEELFLTGADGNPSTFTIVEDDISKLNIAVNYYFLDKENKDYSGMANRYQKLLIDENILTKLEEKDSIPINIDFLGGVNTRKFKFIFRDSSTTIGTTYNQATSIIKDLNENGISNFTVNYLGWFNNGINNYKPDIIKKISGLGSKKDLLNLEKELNSTESNLYLGVRFNEVSSKDKRVSTNRDLLRYLNGYYGMEAEYNRQTMNMNDYGEAVYYCISPGNLINITNSFMKKFQSVGVNGVSLVDLGDIVNSDKNRKRNINRQVSTDIAEKALTEFNNNYDLLITGGNDYSFKYTKNIVNIPDDSNRFYIVDYTIPFYQMVLHGYINYSGKPINSNENQNSKGILLKMIETGASPHYEISHTNTDEFRFTNIERKYSTEYKTWKDNIINTYKEVNNIYKDLNNAVILRHDILENGVVMTTYKKESGELIGVIVNYTENDYKSQYGNILAENYLVTVLGGGNK